MFTLLFSGIFSLAAAQYSQMGNKLVSDGTTNPDFGNTTILSADGNTLVVSASNGIFIYTYSQNGWMRNSLNPVTTLTGPFSLSADAKTLAVGVTNDSNGVGAVYIFTTSGINWSQAGNKLVWNGGTSGQGFIISLSADGKTLAEASNNSSTVYTFSLINGTWSKLNSINTPSSVALSSIGISSDGSKLVVGLPANNYNGSVYAYSLTGSNWSQLGNEMVGTGAGFGYQGSSVCISSDGKTIAELSEWDNNIGAAWVFTFTGANWVQVGNKIIGAKTTTMVQYSLATISLSADGKTLALGRAGDNNSLGAVWIFTFTGSNWLQVGNKVAGGNYSQLDSTEYIGGMPVHQGSSVSLSSNGNTLAFGGIGAVWVFTSSGWTGGNQDSTSTIGTGKTKSDTLSIQGTIYQGATPLSSGVVIGIDLYSNKTYSSKLINGKFDLDSLPKSNYIVYAIPNPDSVPNYLPTYYYNTIDVSKAIVLPLKGHIFGVDINLVPITTTITGTFTITGRFSYADNSSDTGTAYNNNWFGTSYQPANAIPVTGNVVKNLTIFLYNTQGQLLASTISDTSGYFVFANIPAGNYEILGQRSGYTTENNGLTNVSTSSNTTISLRMTSAVTGIENELITASDPHVPVYPNPFKEEINLLGYSGDVTVYDLTGSIYLQTSIQDKEPIQTSNWPAGFYLLKAGNKVQKIIKQ